MPGKQMTEKYCVLYVQVVICVVCCVLCVVCVVVVIPYSY